MSVQPEFQSWEILKQAAVFRSLAENALDGIVISNPQGIVIYANRAAHEMYGYDVGALEMIGIPSRDTWPEDLLSQVGALVGGDDWARRGGWSADLRQKRKDGSEFEAHISSFSIFDETGALVGLAASVRNITAQKRAEEVLRQSEEKFSKVFLASPDAISFSRMSDGLFYDANNGFATVLGYAPDEVKGKTALELGLWVHPEERARFVAHLQKSGQSQTIETEFRRKDGTIIKVMLSGAPVEFGGEACFVAIIRDITEQKQAQTALRRSQQMLQQVIDTIPVRVFWKDRNLVYLGCNRLFAEDAGLTSPDQIIGKDDYAMTWRDQAELYRADDASVIESGTPKINYEEPQTTPDGSTIWLRTSKIPMLDTDGSIMGVLGTYDDITERKQAEETIRQQRQLLRQVVDLMPALVGIKDWNGCFRLANKRLAEIYGTTVEDIVGKTDADFNPNADEVAAFLQADRQVMMSGQRLFIPEEPVTGPSGETCWFQTTKIPLVSDNDEKQLLLLGIDITERKQAEQERERLQTQIIEMQRQAIQELSTPIIPIMDRIIVMPLIGSIDTLRARDITRALLRGISEYRAKVVIVDITGVPLVDTGVANHLDKTIQAARLKGARTIITGVSDAVAETIVDLGIDWGQIETLRDLQSGLLAALNSLGIKVSK